MAIRTSLDQNLKQPTGQAVVELLIVGFLFLVLIGLYFSFGKVEQKTLDQYQFKQVIR